jgi:hypothetical protein
MRIRQPRLRPDGSDRVAASSPQSRTSLPMFGAPNRSLKRRPGTRHTARFIRRGRATGVDELDKQYKTIPRYFTEASDWVRTPLTSAAEIVTPYTPPEYQGGQT